MHFLKRMAAAYQKPKTPPLAFTVEAQGTRESLNFYTSWSVDSPIRYRIWRLAQAGISRFFREIWLYFERSEMRENGLFLEKHHTILRQRRCFGEITQAKSGFIENLLFYSAPENTKKGKDPGAGIGREGNDFFLKSSLFLQSTFYFVEFLTNIA